MALRRKCRGTMSERCALQGRQQALQPSREPVDDGAIAYADLVARGAQRVETGIVQATTEAAAEVGGYAAFAAPSHEYDAQPLEAHVVLAPPSPLEDDPFGFNHLGFDDSGAVSDRTSP